MNSLIKKSIVFMFSGQGSQFFQMGREIYKSDPVFRRTMTRMDEIAVEMTGRSVVRELYDSAKTKGELFDEISLSHPTIFMVESAMVRALSHRGIIPDSIVGASLGEFVAAGLYGMMDFETAFRTILRQTMMYRGELEKGGMIAIMASPDLFSQTPVLRENSEIAAVNFDSHFVVSATGSALENIRAHLRKVGISYFVLPVNYAFHSSHMDRIREKFINLYRGLSFYPPDVAFNSCADAREIHQIDQDYFWRVLRYPIRFHETITRLASEGPCVFVDVGPSGTLATFAGYILSRDSSSETFPILTPFGHELDNFNKILKLGTLSSFPRTHQPTVKLSGVVSGKSLGSYAFKKRFNLVYPCLAGGMFRGISSARLVARMGNAGMMGFFGTKGLPLETVDENITTIRREVDKGKEFGMNLSAGADQAALVGLFLERDITCIEVSGFVHVTPDLVKYRAAGMGQDPDHPDIPRNRIIAKLSRPEVAKHFLCPPQDRILDHLVATGDISADQAAMARQFPLADALCVTADCGGRTDRKTLATLLPVMMGLRDRVKEELGYNTHVFVGAAGGIGSPEAVAAAFVLGADFILTGSINQCTPEAGTSDKVKDLLQQINIQDTTYAPSSGGFEVGAMVQVMSRGVFFPARANKLLGLYQHYNSLGEIPPSVLGHICEKYFNSDLESVYEKCTGLYTKEDIDRTWNNPRGRMALTFKWYLDNAVSLALAGQESDTVNFQIYCGPCLGAFNQWVSGTELENWHARYVDVINKKLMDAAGFLLSDRFQSLAGMDRAMGESCTVS